MRSPNNLLHSHFIILVTMVTEKSCEKLYDFWRIFEEKFLERCESRREYLNLQ